MKLVVSGVVEDDDLEVGGLLAMQILQVDRVCVADRKKLLHICSLCIYIIP